jgi:paraquat-inducible protein B
MNAPAPVVKRGPGFSLVWIVPIVAVAVAGWMIYREWRNHGPEIILEFADGSGLEANKTELEYKGVSVGRVQKVELKPDLSGTLIHLRLDKSATQLAREGSEFWVVHPEIGFSGVRGLDTLVSGVRLSVRPGFGRPATRFRGLDKTPAAENLQAGRAFEIRADRLGALATQAAVLYRDVKVGEVEASRLSDDGTGVLIRIRIHTPYVDLVRVNSQFWNAGGIPLKISLFGGEIRSTSLESILAGAIAFATPDEPGAIAEDGTQFKLNAEADKDWLKWHPKISIHPPEEAPEKTPSPNSLPALLKS